MIVCRMLECVLLVFWAWLMGESCDGWSVKRGRGSLAMT